MGGGGGRRGGKFDNFQASGGGFLGQDKGIGCFLAYANYTQGVRERKSTPWGGQGQGLQPRKVIEMSEVALRSLHTWRRLPCLKAQFQLL